jgi:hypothetical protein
MRGNVLITLTTLYQQLVWDHCKQLFGPHGWRPTHDAAPSHDKYFVPFNVLPSIGMHAKRNCQTSVNVVLCETRMLANPSFAPGTIPEVGKALLATNPQKHVFESSGRLRVNRSKHLVRQQTCVSGGDGTMLTGVLMNDVTLERLQLHIESLTPPHQVPVNMLRAAPIRSQACGDANVVLASWTSHWKG